MDIVSVEGLLKVPWKVHVKASDAVRRLMSVCPHLAVAAEAFCTGSFPDA